MRKINILILGLAVIYFSGCKHSDFEFVKLKDFKYTRAEILPGTEIKLIAYSGTGGKENNNDAVYYFQFIGIDTSTGDTLRILSPQYYDSKKYGRTATFYSEKSDIGNIINRELLQTGKESSKPSVKEIFVVCNNKPEFLLLENRGFKTAIGSLGFKE
jgi:hypothetical protein